MTVPSTLYKYTTAETARVILNSGRLRWQSPCQFNDVQELQRMPSLVPTFEDARQLYTERLVEIVYSQESMEHKPYSPWTQVLLSQLTILKKQNNSKEKALSIINKNIPKGEKKVEDLFRKSTELNNDGSLRCFCLTENDNNQLMWAHYAASHTGCLLGFTHIEELSTPFFVAEKVTYSPDPPIVGSGLDFLLFGPSKELNHKTRLAIYHCKGEEWSYEKEWRVIHKVNPVNSKKHSDFKFYEQELESLTFGLKVVPKLKLAILDIINEKYPNCKVSEIRTSNGKSKTVPVFH